jgi:tetratricopeptide (TPR) repeat protein
MGFERSYRYTRADIAEARQLSERAVALDPGFAAAWGLLSYTYSLDVNYGLTDAPERSVASALEAAHRAVALDPREPVAYAALGNAYLAAGDVRNGLDAARRAVDLNPSMPGAWVELSWAQLLSGDPEGSLTSNRNAQRLDPQGDMVAETWDNMAMAYWEMGRYEESLDAARRLVAAQPEHWWGQIYLALNAVSLGRPDEARAAIAEARRLKPDLSLETIQRSLVVSRPEIDARRNAALRQAGLE